MENMVRDVKEIQEMMVNVGVILDLDIKFEDISDLELIKLGRGVTTQKSRDVYPIIINYGENGISLSGLLNTYYYHERQLEILIEELEYYYSMSGRDWLRYNE